MIDKATTPTANPPYEPDYSLYQPKSISVDQLDMLASFVFKGAAPGNVGAIIAAVKLVIALAYIFARKYLIDSQILLEKQQYEIDERRRRDRDLNNDDLNSRPKNA